MKKRSVYIAAILVLTLAAGCGRFAKNEDSELWTQNQGESSDEVRSEVEEAEETEKPEEADNYDEINAKKKQESKTEESSTKTEESSTGTEESSTETVKTSAATEEVISDQADSNSSTTDDSTASESHEAVYPYDESTLNESGILASTEDIELTDIDGGGKNYTFTYDAEQFSAQYTTDNWKIFDSYKIDNESDMIIICQALIDEKPVHGSDMESFRNAADMAYEWVIHNMAYELLPDDDSMKAHARDVDFDPKDQNKSFEEIYEDRTGKEFDLNDFLNLIN